MVDFDFPPQYVALAQLRNALKSYSIEEKTLLVDELMRRGLDLHYAIPADAPVGRYAPELLGWTALHFAVKAQDEQVITCMVERGARVTPRDARAFSPIRLAIEYPWCTGEPAENDDLWKTRSSSNPHYYCSYSQTPIEIPKEQRAVIRRRGKVNHPLLKLMLQAQRGQNDTSNPSCRQGVSHLHIACMLNDAGTVEFLLRAGASAEDAISPGSPHLAGYRPVHVAVRYRALETLRLLLEAGADPWAREARGLNALQLVIENGVDLADAVAGNRAARAPARSFARDNALMARLLLARLADESAGDEFGFGRLHVAASTGDESALEELVALGDAGTDWNVAASPDSPHWPGYTPLHFAARCGGELVKLLVERGADLCVADASGITPFDLCLHRCRPADLAEIMAYDETLKHIKFQGSEVRLCDAVEGLQNERCLEKFRRTISSLNDPVSSDSPLWPGWTLTHISVTLMKPPRDDYYLRNLNELFNFRIITEDENFPCNFQNSRDEENFIRYYLNLRDERTILPCILVSAKANPLARDTQNSTPVHLAFRQGKFKLVKELLGHLESTTEEFDDVIDSDGLSLLHVCACYSCDSLFERLVKNADVNVRTRTRLTFKWKVHSEYPQLHLNSGSTPLHFATATESPLVEDLVKLGADPLAEDDEGLTPILLTFITRPSYFCRFSLLATPALSKSDSVTAEGLSHLHLASIANNVSAAKSFVARGVDVNIKIKCGLSDTYADWPDAIKSHEYYVSRQKENETVLLARYAGYTPLHFAVESQSLELIAMLVEWGADVHVRNARGLSPLHMALMSESSKRWMILNCLLEKVDMTKSGPIDDYGITPLHIACRRVDTEWINRPLYSGHDVNARIVAHSPIWPGYTPLLVLTHSALNDYTYNNKPIVIAVSEIAMSLVEQGADVTIPNTESITPLHDVIYLFDPNPSLLEMLFSRRLKHYDVSQKNAEGVSFIHLACLTENVELVKQLCAQGANVNQPIDYFTDEKGGCTPLHLAAMMHNATVTQFLLTKGASVKAEDCRGSTPLHSSCSRGKFGQKKVNLIPLLCDNGADVESRDIFGRVPLELVVQSPSVDQAFSLLTRGARANTMNVLSGESLLSKVISKSSQNLPIIMDNVKDSDILFVTEDGSTAIHNSVRNREEISMDSDRYIFAIERLVERGCAINAQDNRGRTALHVAVEYDNHLGVYALLACGIDANKTDNDGNVALNLLKDRKIGNNGVRLTLLVYLHKFHFLGLEMCQPNRILYDTAKSEQGFPRNEANYYHEKIWPEIDAMKEFMLHENFSLRDLVTERAIKEYPMMPRARREAIIKHLAYTSELYSKFPVHRSPIRFQYRRILERMESIEPAKNVLRRMLGNILPELCLEKILILLNNEDLVTLIDVAKPSKNKSEDDEFLKCKKVKYV